MNAVTLNDALEATHGKLLGNFRDLDTIIPDASTHSKEKKVGAVFLAFRGDNIDGHWFIDEALENGCAGCITEVELDHYRDDKYYLLVDDTLEAIWRIAALKMKQRKTKVICVTGSVGKTTTTSLIAHVLRSRYSVFETKKNHNDEFLCPGMILNVDDSFDYAIIELGIGEHSSVKKMAGIIRPDAIVLTNIGHAHIGKTGSISATRDEKCGSEDGLLENGIVFVNRNDKLLSEYPYKHRVVYYGYDPDISARHHVPAYLEQASSAAKAVGRACGLTDVEIAERILSFKSPEGRMEILHGKRFSVIDSSFNASIESMSLALQTLRSIDGRHIAILGEMLEIGDYSDQIHIQLASMLHGIDTVVFVGDHAKMIGCHIPDGVKYFGVAEIEDALHVVNQIVASCCGNEVLLVKGSHGSGVWRIAEALKEMLA